MAPRKIAYLTPLYFDETSCLGGGERYPAEPRPAASIAPRAGR